MTKQDTIRHGQSPHIEAGQGNHMGGKESQEQAKESEMTLLPLLGVQRKHQASSHSFAEDLVNILLFCYIELGIYSSISSILSLSSASVGLLVITSFYCDLFLSLYFFKCPISLPKFSSMLMTFLSILLIFWSLLLFLSSRLLTSIFALWVKFLYLFVLYLRHWLLLLVNFWNLWPTFYLFVYFLNLEHDELWSYRRIIVLLLHIPLLVTFISIHFNVPSSFISGSFYWTVYSWGLNPQYYSERRNKAFVIARPIHSRYKSHLNRIQEN